MKKMIIVGGGAAGMMTAIHAAENYKVLLLEKNDKLGKKLFITGKGRCNLTNACDEETFLKNVMSNPKFLYSAISAYPPEAVIRSFQDWGLQVKTERGNRVFPESDHSSDVIRTLEQQMRKRGVEIRLNTHVRGLVCHSEPVCHSERCEESSDPVCHSERSEESSDPVCHSERSEESPGPVCHSERSEESCGIKRVTGVLLSDGTKLTADVVVLATGGISYPGTGASGEGVTFLEKQGLSIRPFQPSLVPMESDLSICKPMMGLAPKNVEVSFYRLDKPKKPVYREFGEMLFTHFGVSGPVILSASGMLQKYFTADGRSKERLELRLDWKPALTPEQLDQRILRDFDQAKNKTLQNAMEGLLPRAAILPVLALAEMDPELRVHDLKQEQRRKLVETLKAFRLPITGLRGFDEAIISAGGLSVKEIDPRTMEVKRLQGLRVAGEMIDCDALTGGFNLQIAWCTAKLAAQ